MLNARTRIKICGITRPQDALTVAACGGDAIGLVFYPKSPRAVTIAQARAITAVLPPFVSVVGLFVDAEHFAISDVLEAVPVDILQFHGSEPPGVCAGFGRPYIKAVRMREDVDVEEAASQYHDATALLLDTFSSTGEGGTGEVFDWSRVPRNLNKPIILAGGLTPSNVAQALRRVGPYAVDVSSGVESAPGIKDAGKIAAFVRAVNA